MRTLRTSRGAGLVVCAAAYASAAVAAWGAWHAARGAGLLVSAAAGDLAATFVIFLFSLAANNSSLYDPYWSVAPPVLGLSWLIAGRGGVSVRGVLCLALVAVWSVRLTANWVMSWRGLQHEDWRYASFRGRRGYWLISLVGFHLMPTVLVFLGSVPLYFGLSPVGRPLGVLDLAAAAVTAGAILIEAVADRELRAFRRSKPGEAVLDRGLWAPSRHPNYFGEVLFWWGLWLFAVAGSPRWWWTIVGPGSITALFLGVSVPMMDRHMLARHHGYASQMRTTCGLVPWFPRRAAGPEA